MCITAVRQQLCNSLSNLEKRPKINTVPDRISPNSRSEAGEQASNALRAESQLVGRFYCVSRSLLLYTFEFW
jgi:hypothetical protein